MAGLRVGRRVGRADMVDLRADQAGRAAGQAGRAAGQADLRAGLVDLQADRADQADQVDIQVDRAGQAGRVDPVNRAGQVIGHHHFTGRRQYRPRIHNGGGGRCLTTPTTHAKDSCSPATHNLPLRSNTRDKR
jgi:hypothetical protein